MALFNSYRKTKTDVKEHGQAKKCDQTKETQ